MDNFKPQIKGMKIASHDIDAKQFPTHCTVKNRIVFRPAHSDGEKSKPIKEISKFYATVPDGAVITGLSATIGTQRLSSSNWKYAAKCHAKKVFPHCKVTNYGDEIICDTKPTQGLWCMYPGCKYSHWDSKFADNDRIWKEVDSENVPGTNCWCDGWSYPYCPSHGGGFYCIHKITYRQIGNGCEKFLHDLGEIRKYDNKSDVICAITYQVPDMSIISKADNFVKSVRIRVPTKIDPQQGPVISAKLENMKKSRKNRSVANVNGITIDAKIVKNTKVGKKSKQSKRRINNDLEYDISDYCDY